MTLMVQFRESRRHLRRMREMGYGLEHSIFHFPSSICHLRRMEPLATGQGLCEIFSPGASVPRPVLAFDEPQVFRGQAEFAFQTLTNLCQRRTLRTQNQWPQSPQMRNERGEISSKPQTPSTREATSRKPRARFVKLGARSFPEAWCLKLGVYFHAANKARALYLRFEM